MKKRERKLHRRIWQEANGPIPEGMHIHHIDGSRENNDLSNLQLVTPEEHYKIHKERGDAYAASFLIAHLDKKPKKIKNPKHAEFMKGKQYKKGKFTSGVTNQMIIEARERMLKEGKKASLRAMQKRWALTTRQYHTD